MQFIFIPVPAECDPYTWFERIDDLICHAGVDFCDTDPDGCYVVIATPDADRVKTDLENEGFEL